MLVFSLVLHVDSSGNNENLFCQHVWIPDEISIHLIGRTIQFYQKMQFSILNHRYNLATVDQKLKILFLSKSICCDPSNKWKFHKEYEFVDKKHFWSTLLNLQVKQGKKSSVFIKKNKKRSWQDFIFISSSK